VQPSTPESLIFSTQSASSITPTHTNPPTPLCRHLPLTTQRSACGPSGLAHRLAALYTGMPLSPHPPPTPL
jgi:hypothetical protein